MSGTQVSSFGNASQNALFDPLMARRQTQYDTNDLLSKQAIGAGDTEMVARLAQSLVNMPEEEAAKAYGPGIAYLQQQGFAKHAPAVYPGHAVAQRLAALAVPAKDQYDRQGALGEAATVPLGGRGAGGGGTAMAPAGGGGTAGGSSFAGGIAGFEGGGVANPPENPRWPVARGGPAGAHQFIASTWQDFASANPDLFKGMTPEQVLAARNDPAMSERATNWYAGENAKALQAANIEATPANLGIAHTLGPGGARKVLGAPDNTPLSQVIPETIAQNPQYGRMTVGDLKRQYARLGPVGGAPATQTAATAPVAPAGGGGQPAPYQVASITPNRATDATPAPVSPPAALPPAEATKQAQSSGQPVPIAGVDGLWALPNGSITTQPPAAPAQPPVATTQQQPPAPRPAEMPAELRTNEVGLRPSEVAEFEAQQRAANTPAKVAQFRTDLEQRKAVNQARKDKWEAQQTAARTEERAVHTADLADQAAVRAAHASDLQDQQAAIPTLTRIAPKIEDGTATPAERRLYSATMTDTFLKPRTDWVDDPDSPGKKIPTTVPGALPPGFPAPDYQPGQTTDTKPPPSKSTPLTAAQAKLATFADRLASSELIIQKFDDEAQSWAQSRKAKVGDWLGYSLNSAGYEQLKSAQENWITSKLRDESGALIGTDEFVRDRKTFFPQPGEGPEAVAQKKAMRAEINAGTARAAGPAYQPPVVAPEDPAKREKDKTYLTPKGRLKWDGKLWQPPGG